MSAADWLTSDAVSAELARIKQEGEVKRLYLGDSVYATFDGYQVTLYTDNGYGPEDTIILEPAVMEALLLFLDSLKD